MKLFLSTIFQQYLIFSVLSNCMVFNPNNESWTPLQSPLIREKRGKGHVFHLTFKNEESLQE